MDVIICLYDVLRLWVVKT